MKTMRNANDNAIETVTLPAPETPFERVTRDSQELALCAIKRCARINTGRYAFVAATRFAKHTA